MKRSFMKKLMLISLFAIPLFAIPLCKAADPYEGWNLAINDPIMYRLTILELDNKQIVAIPDNPNLPLVEVLYLTKNQIEYIDPQILQQFPNLEYLNLNENPITQENVNALREATAATHPNLEIVADDIGPQYAYAEDDYDGSIKPAKIK